MKKKYLSFAPAAKFNSRRFPTVVFNSVAYKSDAKTKEQLEAEKLQRKAAIATAEKAYADFKIENPETDVQKSFTLLKTVLELKGADGDKNTEEKIEALEAAIETVKNGVKAEDVEAIRTDLDITIKAFDHLQTRVKSEKTHSGGAVETKAFTELLAEGIESVKDGFADFSAKKTKSISFELKAVADMSFANNFPTARTSVAYVKPGIIELPKRKLHIRELLPGGGMGQKSTFDFVKEVAGEGTITTVAEGALKPQIDLDLQEASVKAEWIAGFLNISRNMLDDVVGMTTFLQSRLPELLLRAEDTQILTGNGTSPNLSGILNPGNFTTYDGAYTIDVEQLVGAVSQLEGYDREANGILLNPADWYAIWLTKSTGSVAGLYNLPSEMIQRIGDQMYIAGVPVFRSTAVAKDTFIVGDWVMGINFISREPMRVEFFYEDVDNVRKNRVTVRVEERVALPIYGNNYFIKGDFGNIAS